MALFMIERNWAQALEVQPETVQALQEINDDCGVRWLTSFLSADKRKTYCLYEAIDPEQLREAARRANIPADAIVELDGEIGPGLR
jgi:hypothetical protein